ncbi:MAG: outer membrane beta-barrel protein [Candidatus Aquirickettsiella sp.]
MQKRNTIALVLVSGIFSSTQNVQAEMPGFYAGAQLGYANSHINTSNLVTVSNGTSSVPLPDLNNLALAYRLSFGYQFDQYWAMEFAYRHFSNTDISVGTNNYIAAASSKSSAFDLTAKGILPVTAKLNFYAKLGLAYLRPNANGSLLTISPYSGTTHSYSKTLEPTFGLGISYALKPNVPVEFSWNRIQKMGGGNHAPSSDFYSLGVSYYFG